MITFPFFDYPVSSKHQELIFLGQFPAVDFRCADKAMVLQAEVTEGPCHGEARRILVRQPHPRHVRFVVHGEHSSLAVQDPCKLACCHVYRNNAKCSQDVYSCACAKDHEMRSLDAHLEDLASSQW